VGVVLILACDYCLHQTVKDVQDFPILIIDRLFEGVNQANGSDDFSNSSSNGLLCQPLFDFTDSPIGKSVFLGCLPILSVHLLILSFILKCRGY
jgi:hypothetical protein